MADSFRGKSRGERNSAATPSASKADSKKQALRAADPGRARRNAVEFPNRDPFFHNVFSLFEGKRFDLGLYEAGTTRSVHFDHAGVSYIFCNIHPEMSAAVIALKTPYYAISNAAGSLSIPDVPPGRYQMQVWYEGSSPEALKRLTREITLNPGRFCLGDFEDC